MNLNSMQLLYYQSPISAILLILPVLVCEPVFQLVYRSWTLIELVNQQSVISSIKILRSNGILFKL